MYYVVPVIDNEAQVDYRYLIELFFSPDGDKAYVKMEERFIPQEGYVEITEEEFTSKNPKKDAYGNTNPSPDSQQLATDAIMAGIIDMSTQQAQAMDALMAGMMDLYAQIEALKNQGGTA
jgi:hypothetical protein